MNSNKNIFCLFFAFLCTVASVNAQELLTIEDAVKIALDNNFEIKIASNNLQISENNNTIGNAGMLPIAKASVVDNNSIENTSQTRQDGTSIALDNAKNNNLNYGVGLDWTVFDGLRMFARAEQLEELKKLGKNELKRTVLLKIGQVNLNYYDLVQQQQQLTAIDSSISISKERLQLAKNRFSIGKASKLEVLNAQVDLNTDQVALLRQKETYQNTKILLNQILARDANTPFTVVDALKVNAQLKYDELLNLSQKQNPALQAQIINNRIAELQLKQVKGNRYPILTLNSGYNFADSKSSLGFTSQANSKGLNYGFTASMTIFDGFNQNRNEKNAKIEVDNALISLEQQNQFLIAQLAINYQTYLTNIDLISLEANNEAIARQNLDITMDKFKIGTITTLEFRTAQLNHVNAKLRYSNAQFQAKLSEIALKELTGTINF
ncbi:TolC family protein [Flavobacterium sp. TAB 87]|uniref:TolC family protein n=1 Tax=Flavobacterium sp. TAB 87 TaxID=1729581 RepID=UPI00076DDCF5|nr:TolC family protein [Flavobacterium sp. TAB 87]KVV15193.1 outer membrane channel protein [Flavobacterium sp. TAB 87]